MEEYLLSILPMIVIIIIKNNNNKLKNVKAPRLIIQFVDLILVYYTCKDLTSK